MHLSTKIKSKLIRDQFYKACMHNLLLRKRTWIRMFNGHLSPEMHKILDFLVDFCWTNTCSA
jgi:hypothetical protein